jgi:hypothetical protein
MQSSSTFFKSTTKSLERISNETLSLIASVAFLMLFLVLFLFTSLFIIPTAPAHAQGAVLTTKQVLEYALTLEKLEADFYRRAVKATQSGGLVNIPQTAKDAIISYGEDEASHVSVLSGALLSSGGNPNAITIPANPNYNAILGGYSPFANLKDFLQASQYVEDLGVAAYKGQVQNLQAAGAAGRTVLAAALEIHSVEARHAAGIRYLRQTLLNANIRPWIRSPIEVKYPELRTGYPIDFADEAFDGFATRDDVLKIVGPILKSVRSASEETSSDSSPV